LPIELLLSESKIRQIIFICLAGI